MNTHFIQIVLNKMYRMNLLQYFLLLKKSCGRYLSSVICYCVKLITLHNLHSQYKMDTNEILFTLHKYSHVLWRNTELGQTQQDSHMVFTKSSHCVIQTHSYSKRRSKSNKHNQKCCWINTSWSEPYIYKLEVGGKGGRGTSRDFS